MPSRRTVRFITGCAWLIVAIMFVVYICAGASCNMLDIADDRADSAAEYALISVAEYIHNSEEKNGLNWRAQGYCDCESKYIKSITYTIDGRTVRYVFEINVNKTAYGCNTDTAHYKVTVDYIRKRFNLVMIETMKASE